MAQNVPEQRQAIVNVICGYLRMPYRLPDASENTHDEWRAGEEERQVRFTAQRIITCHLRPATETFWPDIDLDLSSATLVDIASADEPGINLGEFDLSDCRLRNGRFVQAHFTKHARFEGATFTGTARFDFAVIRGEARFERTQFLGDTSFKGAIFRCPAHFDDTHFAERPSFDHSAFEKRRPKALDPYFPSRRRSN